MKLLTKMPLSLALLPQPLPGFTKGPGREQRRKKVGRCSHIFLPSRWGKKRGGNGREPSTWTNTERNVHSHCPLLLQDTSGPRQFEPTKFIPKCPVSYNLGLAYNCGHGSACPDDRSVLDTLALGPRCLVRVFGTKVSWIQCPVSQSEHMSSLQKMAKNVSPCAIANKILV